MRRARLLITGLVVSSLFLAGCGGDDEKEPEADTPEATQPTEDPGPTTWPLSGLPIKAGEDADKKHPVMVLKMDNTSASSPQQGLGTADLVVEELVEGGMTRLAVLYHSKLPGEVGPVRSMRASDIGIVLPTGGAVVTSGAAAPTIDRVTKAGITFFQEGAPGFYREGSRSAPYNLFTDMKKTAKEIKDPGEWPADYLPWGTADALPAGRPATSIAASFSGGHTTNWTFRDGVYVNENTYAGDNDEFPAETVLVLRVRVGDAGYTDPAGNPVPETKFEGKGKALLFHDGKLVRGTWSKEGLDGSLALETQAGELTVPAGKTWIELVPADGGDVTFTE